MGMQPEAGGIRLGMRPKALALDKPSPARMYDYFLGGYHNFEVDRAAAAQVMAVYPDAPRVTQANRAFLRRAVHFLLDQGVTQFLDIGSGIPTIGNVHEVAQQANPAARVVYVDSDPVAVAHSESLLRDNPTAAIIHADARELDGILAHPEAQRLLDFDKPVAVLLVALLHFFTDDEAAHRLMRDVRGALPPGSYVAISHGVMDDSTRDMMAKNDKIYSRSTNPTKARSRAEIEDLCAGLDMVEPGVVYTPLWHPEGPRDVFLDQPERSLCLAGVGRTR
jgi:hypothetical protein